VNRPGLISVRPELVKEVLVAQIAAGAVKRARRELTPSSAALISSATARLGYEVRNTEAELFEPARQPAGWLQEELRGRLDEGVSSQEAIRTLSEELAAAEPAGLPAPDDERAVTWRVPGPGGHVRHYVAEQLAAADKRTFVYGFAVRCCEEALAGEPPVPSR
jgi:hypothetical protein